MRKFTRKINWKRDAVLNILKDRVLKKIKRSVSRVVEACFNRLTRVSNVEPSASEDE